jgi:hypothetical protein
VKLAAAAILAVVAVAASACGGGGGRTSPTLTRDDLLGVVGPAPDTPQGAAYSTDAGAASYTLSDLRAHAASASDRRTVRTLADAGFEQIYQRTFNGAVNVADATAYLFETAAGAGTAFAYLRTTLSDPGKGSGRTLKELSAKGLGDESWAAHLTGNGESALFLWRTGNLVVVADMSCDDSCGFDVAGAARSYATGIDERARES